MINEPKTAQIAGLILKKSGGRMSVLKLMKLMYLVERKGLVTRTFSLTGDRPVSMPHGPVLSQSYDFVGGTSRDDLRGWNAWVCDREGYDVEIHPDKAEASAEDFDELSPADHDLIHEVLEQFGEMRQWELVEWTHKHCSEWQDPDGSSNPIPISLIFEATGKSSDQAKELAAEIDSQRRVDAVFNSLRQ